MPKVKKTDTRSDDERLRDRLMALVRADDGPDGCWHWTSYREQGYARAWPSLYVHRELLRLAGRTKTPDRRWRRSCASEDCVRPEHYKAATPEEIWEQSEGYGYSRRHATACIHGHPYNEENTYRATDGTRHCLACRREVEKRRVRDRRKKKTPVAQEISSG